MYLLIKWKWREKINKIEKNRQKWDENISTHDDDPDMSTQVPSTNDLESEKEDGQTCPNLITSLQEALVSWSTYISSTLIGNTSLFSSILSLPDDLTKENLKQTHLTDFFRGTSL